MRVWLLGAQVIGLVIAISSAVSPAVDVKRPIQGRPELSWSLKMTTPLETGIVCMDLDRMLSFYTEVLGLRFVADAEATPEMSKQFGATSGGFRIVRLQTPYGERIKLVRPASVIPRRDPDTEWVFARQGTTYITFVVTDIREVAVRLREHQVKLMSQQPVEVRKGVIALFAKDPENNFIEFVEYLDVQSYRPDLYKWRQFF